MQPVQWPRQAVSLVYIYARHIKAPTLSQCSYLCVSNSLPQRSIFPLFPGCGRKCEIMDSKFETGWLIFLSSCQVQIFELPDLLAQELVERTVSILTHTSLNQSPAQRRNLTGVSGGAVLCLGASSTWDRKSNPPGTTQCYLKVAKTSAIKLSPTFVLQA